MSKIDRNKIGNKNIICNVGIDMLSTFPKIHYPKKKILQVKSCWLHGGSNLSVQHI